MNTLVASCDQSANVHSAPGPWQHRVVLAEDENRGEGVDAVLDTQRFAHRRSTVHLRAASHPPRPQSKRVGLLSSSVETVWAATRFEVRISSLTSDHASPLNFPPTIDIVLLLWMLWYNLTNAPCNASQQTRQVGTLARKRRSSPGYFWARVAVLFSQTGSRRWHQWHHGAKKLTIIICACSEKFE